ncbi:MAG: hypothetical protein ACI9T7_003042 [Oleiphilaceae bacterium]|jgi:hypothetical protein
MSGNYQGRNWIMKILLLIALIATSQSVFAHRGGLDSSGGHNDRKNGGLAWSKNKKERFTNDPLNLLAVDDGLNQSKGANFQKTD